jgi:hypothetical protein
MKNLIIFTFLLLTTTMKAITYPANWGADRIFLYDFWDQCGKPAGVNWGDLTKNIAELNSISVTHPDNAVEPNFYKVSKVYGSDKGFVGQIPAGIENLTELEVFQLNNNTGLTGIIPACFATFQKLDYLNLKNCNFTGMAAPLTKLPRTQLELHYNRIPYGDLLPMKSLARTAPGANPWSYDYLPQYTDLKVTSITKDIISGNSLSLDIDVLLPNHGGATYKWYRNDIEVGTGKIYAVTMSNLTTVDYQCEITTDADMLNAATCPASNWVDARTAVYPQWAITNKTEKISVTLATATSIANKTAETTKVWTMNSTIYFSNIVADSNIEVLNLLGKVISTTNGKQISNGLYIPLKGIYLVRIKKGSDSNTMKVIL